MKTLYFDCACGASGDMIVGALLDLGVSFEGLREALRSLGVSGFDVQAEKVNKKGIMATQFRVHVHEHEHPHRHLKHVLAIIESGDLPDAVRAAASETFRRIAECEAAIHGTTVEKIHFHEVGAVDSIVDIIGAHWALDHLGVERIVSSPLNVGSGTVHAAHGVLPVPAPATAALLRGAPSYGSGVDAELVTPTGAALIAQSAHAYGPQPLMSVSAVGYGSGMRDLPDRANVLRVILGEAAATLQGGEKVAVVEFNVDDMNPELFPPLVADLLGAGARDAFVTPMLGKKGRPGFVVTAICDEGKAPGLLPAIFGGSSTLGVRVRVEERVCLQREWKTARTPWGGVRIKLGRFEGHVTCASPEFEDCRRVADEKGVAVAAVYEAARAAYARGEMDDA